MAKKYIFVRMPEDTYRRYKGVRDKMQTDIKQILGKEIHLPMVNVFKAIISPEYNENFIEIDLHKLSGLGRKKRK